MSKIKWDLIFINNDEFKIYLKISDFKELSLLSKLVRSKLKFKVLSSIYIDDNIDSIIYREICNSNQKAKCADIEITNLPIIQYTQLFNRSLLTLAQTVNSVYFKTFSNHYQLLEISISFPMLTNLSLYNTIISLTTFKNALNKLECLEIFSIEAVNLIQYRSERYNIAPIKLPNSLRSINCNYTSVYLCDLETDPQTLNDSVYGGSLSEHSPLLLHADYFPRLKKFSSFSIPVPFYTELISKNNKLISLDLGIEIFDKSSADIFYKMQDIKKLELLTNCTNFDINSIKLNLSSLTHLKFYHVNNLNWNILEKLALSSPNLVEFEFNFSEYTDAPLAQLINNIPSLRRLVIKSIRDIEYNFEELKTHPNLNYLELLGTIDIRPLLLKLHLFPCFKSACFRKDYYKNDLSLLIQDKENILKPWKLVKTELYYKYYKLP